MRTTTLACISIISSAVLGNLVNPVVGAERTESDALQWSAIFLHRCSESTAECSAYVKGLMEGWRGAYMTVPNSPLSTDGTGYFSACVPSELSTEDVRKRLYEFISENAIADYDDGTGVMFAKAMKEWYTCN